MDLTVILCKPITRIRHDPQLGPSHAFTAEGQFTGARLADHSIYGLAAGLFTRDLSPAIDAAAAGRLRDHILPTGGYKQSGIGKDLGREVYFANR